jgi:eukaryotic-like serine/threonine-protein kinase
MEWKTQRIHEYEVERELARGGFGIVYRAKHVETGAPCAVKILQLERAAEASTIIRFEREAALVFDLAHPNLPKIWAIRDPHGYVARRTTDFS